MKFLLLILTILAISCVRSNPEECTEERGEACIDNLLTAILNEEDLSTEEDLCRELLSSIDCLKEVVDDCLGERNSAVDDVFEALDKLLSKCKDNDEEMGELEKCYQLYEGYITECINEGIQKIWYSKLLEMDDVDENVMQCAMYFRMSSCIEKRVHEKCGLKAAIMANDELWENEIAEDCNPMTLQMLILSMHSPD